MDSPVERSTKTASGHRRLREPGVPTYVETLPDATRSAIASQGAILDVMVKGYGCQVQPRHPCPGVAAGAHDVPWWGWLSG